MVERIFVTGVIRSGTTWVGKMISTARRAVYIHEPFNPDANWNAAVPTPQKHFYLNQNNGGPWVPLIENLLRFEPQYPQPWSKDAKERCEKIIQTSIDNWGNRSDLIPVVKDPTALLSTEWLVKHFNLTPVIVTRHPILIVKSLLKLGWGGSPTEAINRQPTVNNLLSSGEKEILFELEQDARNPVEKTCLFVRYLSQILEGFRVRNPNWLFVSHAELQNNPKSKFDELFNILGLEKSIRTREALENKGVYDPNQAHQVSLNPINLEEDVFANDSFSSKWEQLNKVFFDAAHE